MIYHDNVRFNGVILIRELLLKNGYLEYGSSSIDTTICKKCGKTKNNHKSISGHSFLPNTFVAIYGEIDISTRNLYINVFNSDENIKGNVINTILCSKVLSVGIDLKTVRQQIIVSVPSDISLLMQIIGRVDRRGSHLKLPEGERNVNIFLLASELHDIQSYRDKMVNYMEIQKIELLIRNTAIDSHLRPSIPFNSLMSLKFDKKEIDTSESLDSFYSSKHGEYESSDLFDKIYKCFGPFSFMPLHIYTVESA